MSDHPDPDSVDRIVDYLRGQQSVEEAHAFERHIEEGCESCAEDLKALRTLFDGLLHLPNAVDPPAAVAGQLFSTLAREVPAETPRNPQIWRSWTEPGTAGDFQIVKAQDAPWEEIGIDGIQVRRLSVNTREERITMLIRMKPGTYYPAHRHGGLEECFVVSGDLRVGDVVLRSGDFISSDTGSIHGIQSTAGGCTLLIQSSQHDDLMP